VLGASAAFCISPRVLAQTSGASGRAVVERVYPSGPPAAIMLYTLAPDLLIGWPRANRGEEREFLLPDVGARPEVGRLTGRGNTANLEVVLGLRPDLIVDVGTISETYTSLAARVQAQTGIPYRLLDGRFDATPATYRELGRLIGRESRAEELASYCETTMTTLRRRIAGVPEDQRPRFYYARGPRGLDTGLRGSINVETMEFLQARNVVDRQGGLANVSLEQVLVWAPDVIVTIDQDFAGSVSRDPAWASVPAVRDGRVHLSPKLPFGWVDFPPSVNRMLGLWWLAKIFYPALFPEDIRSIARDFHAKFYHVPINEAQLDRILAGRS
jgi:iron complex transport system substrate-binding protein